jgi:hypothetical protein
MSCDQAVLVDHAADASVSSDKVGGAGRGGPGDLGDGVQQAVQGLVLVGGQERGGVLEVALDVTAGPVGGVGGVGEPVGAEQDRGAGGEVPAVLGAGGTGEMSSSMRRSHAVSALRRTRTPLPGSRSAAGPTPCRR